MHASQIAVHEAKSEGGCLDTSLRAPTDAGSSSPIISAVLQWVLGSNTERRVDVF